MKNIFFILLGIVYLYLANAIELVIIKQLFFNRAGFSRSREYPLFKRALYCHTNFDSHDGS